MNVIKAKVYDDIFFPPKSDILTLLERTDKNSARENPDTKTFVSLSVEQRDTLRKKVYVYCVKGGTTLNGQSRWKFKVFDNEIEAVLASDVVASPAGPDYVLNSVFGGESAPNGIHANDYATVVNPDTGAYITRGITTVTPSTNTIRLSSAFGIELKRKTIIIISRDFKLDTSYAKSLWSDAGVGYVTQTGPEATTNDITIEVSSPNNCPVGSIVNFGELMYEYKVVGVAGDVLTLEKLDGTNTNVIDETIAANSIVYCYYAPGVDSASTGLGQNAVFEIGNSNIYIKWFTGDGTVGEDYLNSFIVGDRMVIDCPGKSLEEEFGSLQTVVDSVSLEKYDKNEYTIDNRFLHRALSQELSKRLLVNYSYPKFELTVEVPLVPYIDIVTGTSLTLIDVLNPDLFSNSEGFKEQFTIKSISHNVKTLTTTLILSAIDNY